ncbi:hypothetical protein GCM10010123_24630 [Pilimelia anulata]|uniref:Spread protein n=1 Tax=Pilimelia anulata TaxID=53371 RepID=A0A8J3BB87_9ACTN|nr:hypothetical protein GCM10010123_24630 [Pilimelia anulata]
MIPDADPPRLMPFADEPDPEPRRFYRLRAPDVERTSTAITVRVTPGEGLYVAVGAGRRRMALTTEEAWALWRCLSEAIASTGTPPDWIQVHVNPTPR